ncbi:MAG: hypothetical protein KDE32_15445 [Novosphingobium sp.]|nr:hypothetical protein [Novosphingobium sp.]
METGEPTEKTEPQTNVVALPKSAEPVAAHQKAAAFVREHPVMTIAGGLAIGAVAAALIPRRNRAYVAKQGSLLADAIAAASATVAQQALCSLDTASTSVRKGANSIAARAEHAGELAYGKAQSLLGRKPVAPTLGERIAATAGELAGRLRR